MHSLTPPRHTPTLPEGVTFDDWIGRSHACVDALTPRIAAEFAATLAPYLADMAGGAPLGVFWALAPEIEPAANLGPDGHPRLGLRLPPLPLARRMWAGGELKLDGALVIGDVVEKTSTIESIAFKSGASGPLAFVVVRHVYAVAGRRLIDERQDIVYRAPASEAAKPMLADPVEARAAFGIEATPTLLFRYSALTFNGHRIHYDPVYATEVEGYAGLVVHGPLQATLMLNAAAKVLGRAPKVFRYRGLSPLIGGQPLRVEAFAAPDCALATRVVSAAGALTMSGAVVED